MGDPQAINAGDAMLTLAHLALHRLQETAGVSTAFEASNILQKTCLELTKGQYLDISYETRQELDLLEYWPMVSGKTAALIAACTELGALVSGCTASSREAYRDFGYYLGLAFQALDDLLGIWGTAPILANQLRVTWFLEEIAACFVWIDKRRRIFKALETGPGWYR